MIIRRRHTANFTTIGNVLFEDERLALDEVGLMAWLLSRPNDWEVRRPALMRRFKIGRDGMRRVLRSLLRLGWIRAKVTRLSDGRVHVLYEVRDEPGPELSEDEARAALSLVSSGAGPSDAADDDGEDEGTEQQPDGADPPAGYGLPPTGQPEAASRLRPSPPGHRDESLKPDSQSPESYQHGGRDFADVKALWPVDHVLSYVACEGLHAGLTDRDQAAALRAIKSYLDDCKVQTRKVCDLATYYRERRWERFTAKDVPVKPAEIKPYTPQWHRWHEHKKATGQSVGFMEARAREGSSWYEPTEWPPPSSRPTSSHMTADDEREYAEQGVPIK